MPNFHPLFVHFPIALITVIAFCEIAALITRKTVFRQASLVLAIFVVLGAIGSVATGLAAEESVEHNAAAHELMEIHEVVGLMFLGMVIIYAAIRIVFRNRPDGITAWICAILAVAALAVVSYGAYLGGEMVYRYGVGVKTVGTPKTPTDNERKSETDDRSGKDFYPEKDDSRDHEHGH